MAQPMDDQSAQASGGQQTGGQPVTGTPVPPATGGAGMPPAGGGATAGTTGGATGNDLSGIMEENVDISGLIANAGNQQQQQQFIQSVKIPAHPNTTFNEQEFVQLLAGSISLTINEKYKIVEAIAQLSQFQIDELMKIFREEQQKFSELEQKHAQQVAELEKQHTVTPEELQIRQQEEEKKKQEGSEADDIRKSLGL